MCCVESNDAADKLFHDVLNRKDKADATRNTLTVLHRFKFLFNLPLTIDRNIKKVILSEEGKYEEDKNSSTCRSRLRVGDSSLLYMVEALTAW